MAVVVAVVLQGKYSALWTLIAGMACDSFSAISEARRTLIKHLKHPGTLQVVHFKR